MAENINVGRDLEKIYAILIKIYQRRFHRKDHR